MSFIKWNVREANQLPSLENRLLSRFGGFGEIRKERHFPDSKKVDRLDLQKQSFKEKTFAENFLPTVKLLLPILNERLSKSGSDFFLPSGLSYVDFVIAEQIFTIEHTDPTLFTDFPALLDFKDRVHSLPGIQNYVANRPFTLI